MITFRAAVGNVAPHIVGVDFPELGEPVQDADC